MGSTADKLTYLQGTKTAIKNAIVAKGVTVTDNDTFRDYADLIGDISGEIEAYELSDDASMTSSGVVFKNGVANTLPTGTNLTGGLVFSPNLILQTGDTITLIVHTILQDTGSTHTDKSIVFIGGDRSVQPEPTGNSGIQFDTWAGPRLVCYNVGTGEWYNNNAISQLSAGEYWFKLEITLTSVIASMSTDGGSTYTVLRNQATNFPDGSSFPYVIFGSNTTKGSAATYAHRESIFLKDCSLLLNGNSVYDFVEPLPVLTTKTITSNGTYYASSDDVDGYSSVVVNVPDANYVLPNDANLSSANTTFTNGVLGIYNDSTIQALGGVQYPLSLSVNTGDVIELKLNMAFMNVATGRDRTIFWLSNQTAAQTLWLDLYSGYRIVTWNGSTNGVYTYGGTPTVGQDFYLKLTITMTSATSGNIVLSKSTDDVAYTNIGSSNNITLTEFNFDSLNLGAVQDFGAGMPSYLVKANYFLENCSITINGAKVRDLVVRN